MAAGEELDFKYATSYYYQKANVYHPCTRGLIMARILILGGGVGGSIVANRLARKLRSSEAQITVIDPANRHVYQPGLLYLPFNKRDPQSITRRMRRLLDRRIELIEGTVDSINVSAQSVSVGGDSISYDWLVLATGSQLLPESIPGFINAHHFYDMAHTAQLREAFRNFNGGRIVVGPAADTYKCPAAPLEFMVLLDNYLRKRRLRDQTELCYFSHLPEVFGANSIAQIMLSRFEKRGIQTELNFKVKEIEASAIHSHEGATLAFDIAVVVPPHGVAPAISGAGLTPDGWVTADPYTLKVTGQENVFALGDVVALGRPKTGSVAHYQAPVVVDWLVAMIRRKGRVRLYDGHVLCLIETGKGRATKMNFAYAKDGSATRPSRFSHWMKSMLNRLYWIAVPSGRL